MDNDQRDRRDWPASDASDSPDDSTIDADATGSAEERTGPAGDEPTYGEEPAHGDQPAYGEEPAAADRAQPEAPAPDWGATEAPFPPDERGDEAAAEMETAPAASAEPSVNAAEPDDTDAWPTEPPAAGSGAPDAWPTSAPERAGSFDEPSDDGLPAESTDVAAPDAPWPSEDDAAGPPPSEVEAYPAGDAEADAGAAGLAGAAVAAQGVPDGEAATRESTKCPRCGTENRAGLSFCRSCGQRLVAAGVATTVERPGTPEGTQACPRCGTHNRAGVAFCQNCGANLRGTAPGYVPPAVAGAEEPVATGRERAGAVLGPIVLLIGLVGLVTGYLLPFLYGDGSLFDRAFGADGYGVAFWSGYPDVGAGLADQAYFGLAAPVPLLCLLLLVLAVAGFARARPGALQGVGLVVVLIWSVGLAVLFGLVEVAGNWGGDVVGLLRVLTPAGIIFFLASLIVLIGTLTRFGRS